jgi:dipeptidyl aminopeptidase/acylaminoacyl peptidase
LFFCGVAAAALTLAAAVHADPASHSLANDAAAFGAREAAVSVDISPSGKKLAMLVPGPGRMTGLRIIDLSTATVTNVFRSDGKPDSMQWCDFASDMEFVCQFGFNVSADNDSIVGFTRLMAISSDGKKVRQLGQRQRDTDERVRQFDGQILDWLPDQPGSLLMARMYIPDMQITANINRDRRSGLGVDKIDLATLKSTKMEPPKEGAEGYATDGRGNVRLLIAGDSDGDGNMTVVTHFRYRSLGSRDWFPLGDYDERSHSGISPLAIDATLNAAYVLKKVAGRDALFTVKLDGSRATAQVAANDRVDIDDVVRFGRGQRVIGYTYAEDRQNVVYFDPEFSKLARALNSALPGHPSITFEGASNDGSELLISATSDTMPGRYFVYDKAAHHLDEAASVRPELEGRKLASVTLVAVPGSDHVLIPAYLTMPPNGESKDLPAIVLPHGGPSDRDRWGFDWLAQFLAARGYAVIQPNYRGSSGYGAAWEGKNGFRDWKRAISDITASAHYLVDKGVADPKRLAIVGWSYGGYAALQSVAVEPTLYKAAVAIAPVTDLSLLKRESEHFTSQKLVKDYIGSGPNVVEGSPLQRAGEIKVPVLMFHGDLDLNVSILHSERMAAALTRAGDKAELVRFSGLDHQLRDSDARTQMLTRIGQFLDAAIGH